ncbi:YihY/virulence factor BrkB family protein [Nesterenkonia flava]|uniref:YihY/virulence factor BrkB family protein n=1 Tax=Nesterenkonia flava TaxID=469799 RepID=A0ABU1FRR2_9MICC|nr:YihY/virulence factor BrkB family protein [Nesterenkonia flava]MDR5710932.1 YihY/virulence factor BrkB family protein [Nesterenkonia flava]
MAYSSRLRPRTQHSGALVAGAKNGMERLDNRREAQAKTNPLHLEKLKQNELTARMAYGRAKRDDAGTARVLLALGLWWLARLNRTRPLRALNLFFFHYGTVMAAGAAYMMFFSVAAILFAGFSIAGLIIGGNEDAQYLIVTAVNTALPGLIGEGSNALATPGELFSTHGLNLALTISLAAAVFTSLSWVHGLRSGIRSIWDRPLMAENIVIVKLRDLGTMLVLGTVILTTAALVIGTRIFIDRILEFLGWEADGLAAVLTPMITLFVAFVLDTIMAILLMRVASRLVMPVSALWQSALIAGLGASLLRIGAGELIAMGGETDNPILGPFAVVLGLFFYFYLFSLVYLIASSWGAVAAADHAERSRR